MKTRKDFLWILIVSILILILSSVPTWMGYQAQTSALRFRGAFFDSQDYSAHLAMMEAGAHGAWAYQFRFTTEAMPSAYVRLFYVVLGHVSQWFGLSTALTFEVTRWLLGLIALIALYWLMSQIFDEPLWVRIAFLLAVLGSGLGWLQLIFNWTSTQITPIDFWFIDGYVFFGLALFPHYALVTAAFGITLGLWLRYIKKPEGRSILWIAAITILVQFANPIAFVTVDAAFFGATLFAWWKVRRIDARHLVGLAVLAAAQIPVLAYNVLAFSHDPLWSQYTSQHYTASPPPDYYLWGFAPFIPFVLLGAIRGFRQKSSPSGACILWVITAFVLAYSPLYTQSRFLLDITVPLAILATQGWMGFIELRKDKGPQAIARGKSLAVYFVVFASLSTLQLSLGRGAYLQTHPADSFYPAALDPGIVWLREHADYNDFVLGSEYTSQVLAQKAGIRVYAGHAMETLNNETKQEQVQAFYKGQLPTLASPPIKWVIYGPDEMAIDPDFRAPNTLELVYQAPQLNIYQVK